MPQFMRHGVAQNYGRGDMSFLLQLPDGLVEKIRVAASTILRRKGYSERGDFQVVGGAEYPEMKVQRKGCFRAAAEGSFLRHLLGAVQPQGFDADFAEDAAGFGFRPFNGR